MTLSQKKSYKKTRDIVFWCGITPVSIITRYIAIASSQWYLPTNTVVTINTLILVLMWALFMVVCYNWARYKGYSGWYMLLGIIGLVGFIPLAIMKDKNVITE